MAASNRRNAARVKPKQLTARIRVGEKLHIGLMIENLSMGGAFVRCNTLIPTGQSVKLELMRPGSAQPLGFSATVTSSVGLAQAGQTKGVPGVGLKFDAIPPHLEAWLAELIASSPPSGPSRSDGAPPAPPLLASSRPSQRGLPQVSAAPPPRLEPRGPPVSRAPDLGGDQEGTQAEIPAFVPSRVLDASAVLNEVNALKEMLSNREKLIVELKRENEKLRQALQRHLSAKP